MDLTLGCKEQVGARTIYYLMNGHKLTKDEWTSLVENHIKKTSNREAYEKIKSTVKLWNKHDSIEEVAMHVYASKYCTNLQVEKRERAVKPIKQRRKQVINSSQFVRR